MKPPCAAKTIPAETPSNNNTDKNYVISEEDIDKIRNNNFLKVRKGEKKWVLNNLNQQLHQEEV